MRKGSFRTSAFRVRARATRDLCCAAALSLNVLACGMSFDADTSPMLASANDIETVTKSLYQGPGVNKWPGTVPICFDGRGTSNEAQWFKQSIQNTWGAVTGLNFIYSSTCPFVGRTQYIWVTWSHGSDWGIGGLAYLPVGMHTSSYNSIALGYCDTTDCLNAHLTDYIEAVKEVVAHEVGHALGFLHEVKRPDYVNLDCPLDDGTENTDSETINGGIYLTPTYDPNSIMAACRGWDGANGLVYQEGYKYAERISSGDIYGSQVAYGARFPYWLHPAVTGMF